MKITTIAVMALVSITVSMPLNSEGSTGTNAAIRSSEKIDQSSKEEVVAIDRRGNWSGALAGLSQTFQSNMEGVVASQLSKSLKPKLESWFDKEK